MPETPLTTFVLGVLTPFLMAGGIADPAIARLAAQQAIAAYGNAGSDKVLTVGSIVAFAVTALDGLRLSLAPELPPALKLRLRGNANTLDRSARTNAERLPGQPASRSGPAAAPEPAVAPPPAPSEAENRQDWANAMTRAASDLKANAKNVSPERQAADALWIEALSTAAGELTRPKPPRPGSRADLLRSTILARDPDFPGLGPKPEPKGRASPG